MKHRAGDPHLLVEQRVGGRVQVVIELDVVVDVEPNFPHIAASKGCACNGASVGLSSLSNSSRRLALYGRIVRPLRSAVSSLSRALSAPMLSNFSLRMRASSQRSAICTPTSAFALCAPCLSGRPLPPPSSSATPFETASVPQSEPWSVCPGARPSHRTCGFPTPAASHWAPQVERSLYARQAP